MSERTELPTPRRMAEARGRGQVAHSIELNSAVALLAGFMLLRGFGARLADALREILVETLSTLHPQEITGAGLRQLLFDYALRLGPSVAFLIVGLLVAGLATTFVQTGFLWADKRPAVDLSRVNPLNGLKRLFSGQGLMAFARAFLKLVLVGGIAYAFLRGRVESVLTLSQMDLASAVGLWADLAFSLALRVAGAYLVLGIADYMYQRWSMMRSLRMTRQEVKEDMKSSDGDPFLRGRIRQQQRRIARQRMMSRVPKADVVITNPTHLAVALGYERASMRAPKVLAKGAALVASRIKELAVEHNVPVVENQPLARALFRTVDIDREVPPELYVAVAEVLAFVYSLKANAGRRATRPGLPRPPAGSAAGISQP